MFMLCILGLRKWSHLAISVMISTFNIPVKAMDGLLNDAFPHYECQSFVIINYSYCGIAQEVEDVRRIGENRDC